MPSATPAAPRAPGLAVASLLAGACAIAFAPILVRLSEVGPVATAFWRIVLSLPFAWAWMLRERATAPTPSARPLGLLALAGLFFAGDLGIWHVSIKLTSVANSTLLVNMAPVFVTLAAWRLFGDRITRTYLLGMALALAGAAILLRGTLAFSPQQLAGDLLALVAAVSYAGYILAVNRLRRTASTATIMALSGLVTALALLPAMLLAGEHWMPQSAAGWGVLLALALVAQLGGQSLIAWAMAHLPAGFSSVGLLLQPVTAALLAWALLAEPVAAIQALGGAAVLAGIYLARRGSR